VAGTASSQKLHFFRSANQKVVFGDAMQYPMHAEDRCFIGHQIRSKGVDCKLKELKAALRGLDDAQVKVNAATTSNTSRLYSRGRVTESPLIPGYKPIFKVQTKQRSQVAVRLATT
jgi:hypothetical protein